MFLERPQDYSGKEILLVSHLVHHRTEQLISLGARPLLLTCQESPFIATNFYVRLRNYSSMFTYAMIFPGMQKQVSSSAHYIPMYFPQYYVNEPLTSIPFADKKFLVYVASNKETKSVIKSIVIKLLYGFTVKLIYAFRRKIIRFLSYRNDFDLYGKGWGDDTSEYVTKVYKGLVENKEEKLREYKFVLCLENAVFPGYITEKIFDAFFAGCVPVYIGAPDIAEYIPKDTFINVNDFDTLAHLELFLDSVDEQAYNVYLKNIQDFLSSERYQKWSHVTFSKTVIQLIQSA